MIKPRDFYEVILIKKSKEMKYMTDSLTVMPVTLTPFMAEKTEVFKVQKRALFS